MITQAKIYAQLERDTDLPHDLRMEVIEALLKEYTEEEKGYTGPFIEDVWDIPPLQSLMRTPMTLVSGFKTLAMGGDSNDDESHLNKKPVAQRYAMCG